MTEEDIYSFVPLEYQAEEFLALLDCLSQADINGVDVYCFSKDGIPVLLIGVLQKWDRVYDTLTVFSRAWKPVYFKTVIKEAKSYFLKLDCDRIEHMVRANRPWTDKMAIAFGFQFVATLRKYCNGEDYKLYEVVK